MSLRQLTKRAAEARQIQWPYTPSRWRAWSKARDVPLAPELEAAIENFADPNLEGTTQDKARIVELESQLTTLQQAIGTGMQAVGARERESMLKLIIGMAVGGYGYDPTASRSNVVPDIVSDLEQHGVSLSDETVRRYLKEATGLLLLSPKR